jgi:lipid A 4'-phosphatase
METIKRWFKAHVALLAFLATVLFFFLFPNLDLLISNWFYSVDGGFVLTDQFWVQLSYRLFHKIHFLVLAVLCWLLFASWRWRRSSEQPLRTALWFLILVLLLGPGLSVSVVKDNSGRARPAAVSEFGGEKDYTPALSLANQCERNCSLVSGHAAMGFFFISLAWVFRDRRWLWAGIVLGSLVGLGRIVQGGHFFSDVVFSFWIVYASCVLLARLVLKRKTIEEEGCA